jgi:PAS domain S-box-containing protein
VQTTDEPLISVVLVDDSAELRGLVRRWLERSGLFEVVGEGGDGDEAISLAIRHEPDLLLLDTSMPTCDGLQALPGIVAVCPDTTVVMYTGFHESSLAERARELGAADFVEKSVPLGELPERLMSALRRASPRSPDRSRLTVVADVPGDEATSQEQDIVNEHVAQFQELFDRAAIGMATMTVTGTIVRANRAMAALMSCQPFDLVGVDYGELMAGSGDRLDEVLTDIRSGGRDLATLEHPLPGELSGSPVARLTLAPIRDSRGQVLYVFAQVQDISDLRAAELERRASEQHFRLLVAAVREYAIFMLDVNGKVVSWNVGAQRIKGYAAHEIIGRSFRVFYPADEQAAGHPESNLALALRDGAYAEEGWRVRKDGTHFWASVVVSPVYDDSGQHIGFAKVTRDQSAQRQHDQERADATDQQTHLLALTAHELRNPAAVIEASVTALGESTEDSSRARHELLANINGSAHRLRRLAADLSTASQLQRGTLFYQHGEISLAELVGRAATRARIAGNDVRVDPDPPPEVTFLGDAIRLAQALDNLLENAARHGAPPVTLGCTVTDDAVVIRVGDSGRGVPQRLEPELFDRFAISGPRGGTGLGLYLVREIVQAHGGDVEYQAAFGDQRHYFEIHLPRTPPPRAG